MHRRLRFLAAATLAAGLGAASAGGAGAADAQPLSLADALDTAARLNETNEIANARLIRARAQHRQALALLLPAVSASAQIERTSTGYSPYGGRPGAFENDSLSVTLTLLNPAAYPAVGASALNRDAQALDSGELRRALSFEVVAAYLQVVSAERELDAAGRRRAVAQRLVDEGRARVEAGVATANDQTRNELELASAEVAVTNAALAARTARLGLGNLVAEPVERPLVEPPQAEIPPGDAAAVTGYALQHRVDLAADALRVRADDRAALGQRLGYLPTLGVRGGWGVVSNDHRAYADGTPDWSVSLVAQWSLYDGGARLAAAEAITADSSEASATLRSARRQVGVDVAIALETLIGSLAASRQAEVQLRVARNNLDEVHAKAVQGLATGLQEADASAAVFEAEASLIARNLAVQSSRFALRQVVGWWPLADAAPAEASGR